MNKELIKQTIYKASDILNKYTKENEILKEKGKFNLQQANYTMKRSLEEFASFIIKEIKKNE